MTTPWDIAFVLPRTWWYVDLREDRLDGSVAGLVAQQFRGSDNLPQLAEASRRELVTVAENARDKGAIQLWVSTETAGPVPMPATLVVSLVAPAGVGVAAEWGPGADPCDVSFEPSPLLLAVRDAMTAQGGEPAMVKLPVGPAVRVRRLRVTPARAEADQLPATVLDFTCTVPGTATLLVMSFSTPLPGELAEASVELFDAIAETAGWVW